MRFLHAADIHLDSPLAGLRARAGARAEELAGATRRAFTRMVDLALDQAVDLVLIAGDLYDGDWKDFSTGLVFVEGMARLDRAGIRVALIKGNHDAENLMTRSLSLPNNVYLFASRKAETWVLEDLGVAVHGRSFPSRAVTENWADQYPPALPGLLNIGLLHTALDGIPGHAPYAPCTIADLVGRGYDYWALGHIHQRMVLRQDPWIVFPGNVQGRHANETGAKGVSLVTVEGGRIRTVEHVPVDVVRWERLACDLTGVADMAGAWSLVRDALADAVAGADGRTLAVRLVLTGATAAHRSLAGNPERTAAEAEALALQVGGDVWIESVRVETADTAAPGFQAGDALGDLLRLVSDLRADGAERDAIAGEIDRSLTRLPADIREMADLTDLSGPSLDRVLADAEAMLLDRLLGERRG
ncbi:MAG: hypothetical protein RLY86_1240 [Pseudomonadota bacterium]|jgi:hypothetical protein